MKNLIPVSSRSEAGIYAIYNAVNAKQYIGSTHCFQSRFYTHRSTLESNTHANEHLQRSYNKHGSDAFEFKLLQCCSIEDVKRVEQHWIDLMFGPTCYNINPTVTPASLNGRHIQTVQLVSPTNELVMFTGTQVDIANSIFQMVDNPPLFKTCYTSIHSVLNGKKIHFRGWRLPTNEYFDWTAPKKINHYVKTYNVELKSPDGTIYGPITNISQFCRDHNIANESTIHNLIAGRTRYINGWSIAQENAICAKNSKEYNIALVDPAGIVWTLQSNLSQFARDHNLEKSGLQHLIWGKQSSHRGWRLQP